MIDSNIASYAFYLIHLINFCNVCIGYVKLKRGAISVFNNHQGANILSQYYIIVKVVEIHDWEIIQDAIIEDTKVWPCTYHGQQPIYHLKETCLIVYFLCVTHLGFPRRIYSYQPRSP